MNKFKLSLLCLLGDYFFLKLFKYQCSIFNMLSNLILRFTSFFYSLKLHGSLKDALEPNRKAYIVSEISSAFRYV